MRGHLRLGHLGGGRVHNGLVFHRRQSAQPGLPAPAVIGPLDHVMIAVRSSPRVRHDLRFRTFFCSSAKNDSIAALSPYGTNSAHRSDQIVAPERGDVFPRSKLRSAVRMHHASGHVPAARDRHFQGIDREAGLHPGVHGVADDPS